MLTYNVAEKTQVQGGQGRTSLSENQNSMWNRLGYYYQYIYLMREFHKKIKYASRTFTHRTLAHNWNFIDACQVNRPFKDYIFPVPCSRVNGLFDHIRFVVLFYNIFSFLGRLSWLSCKFT